MKKFLCLLSLVFFLPVFAATNLQGKLNNAVEEMIPQVKTVSRTVGYAAIAREIQFWIFVFIGVIAVGYIMYIGAKLLWAPGNMEEMSKSMTSLMYVVIGLALIPFAYFLINFIINIRL